MIEVSTCCKNGTCTTTKGTSVCLEHLVYDPIILNKSHIFTKEIENNKNINISKKNKRGTISLSSIKAGNSKNTNPFAIYVNVGEKNEKEYHHIKDLSFSLLPDEDDINLRSILNSVSSKIKLFKDDTKSFSSTKGIYSLSSLTAEEKEKYIIKKPPNYAYTKLEDSPKNDDTNYRLTFMELRVSMANTYEFSVRRTKTFQILQELIERGYNVSIRTQCNNTRLLRISSESIHKMFWDIKETVDAGFLLFTILSYSYETLSWHIFSEALFGREPKPSIIPSSYHKMFVGACPGKKYHKNGMTRMFILDRSLSILKEAMRIKQLIHFIPYEELERLDIANIDEMAKKHGIKVKSFPLVDNTAPSSVSSYMNFVYDMKISYMNVPTVIFCKEGVGRSALFAASMMVIDGMSSQEAIEHLRYYRYELCLSVLKQRQFLNAFEKRLNNISRLQLYPSSVSCRKGTVPRKR